MAKKAAIVDSESATTLVNLAEFQRTRDSVIVALAALQSSLSDLSRAYIRHANTVLAPGHSGPLDTNLTSLITEAGLISGQPATALPLIADAEIPEKKKRKRLPHDPLAPKRALTPYFLYMQHARGQIAKELGENAKPKEVADEGTRRWGQMNPTEKAVWDEKYKRNLAVYRVRMAAYKAAQPVPSEEDAARLVDAGKAAELVAVDAPETEEEEEEEVDEAVESSPEPVREPSPPKSKRRKSEKKVEETPVKETPRGTKAKKSTKKEASPAPASTSKATKAKKGKK